jgi:hypothetical protein
VGGDKAVNLTASALVKTGSGDLVGIWVASTSAGTVKLWNNTAASGAVLVETSTLNTGWNAMPFPFTVGLYITIGGTLNCTLSFN